MSQYTAHIDPVILATFEQRDLIDEILDQLIDGDYLDYLEPGPAPEVLEAVVIHSEDDFHAAAEAFALSVKNRRAPVCRRFPIPSDPW